MGKLSGIKIWGEESARNNSTQNSSNKKQQYSANERVPKKR